MNAKETALPQINKIVTKVNDIMNGMPTGDVFEKIEWYAKGVGLIKVDALDDSDGGFPGLGDVELHHANIGGVEY